MHANFNLPLAWAVDEADASETELPLLDPSDKTMIDIIAAIREFTEREKLLALLLIRTISTWSAASAET